MILPPFMSSGDRQALGTLEALGRPDAVLPLLLWEDCRESMLLIALCQCVVVLTMGLGHGDFAGHAHEGTPAGVQIAKAAAQEDNQAAAQEVVLRIPALANYRAVQGDPRLLETLANSGWMISGAAYLAHVQL